MTKHFVLASLFFLGFFDIASATKPTWTPEDCAADVSGYNEEGLKKRVSIFDKSSAMYSKVNPSKVEQYSFEDSAKLKDGTTVTFTVGGCAHYAYTFKFNGLKAKPKTAKDRIARAEKVMRALALTSKDEKDVLLRALAEGQKQKAPMGSDSAYFLPCGDATCTLTDAGKGEFSLSYDFPL